ncbi:unnamed protein product [Effrenium voratum]|uniref:Uncharacterized protein n=1 Tax=Effrenium voratum TaxID=2562239 RepID=A0AA36HVD8_9DINO|nr:unnamed protein product [Effrenium voratum]
MADKAKKKAKNDEPAVSSRPTVKKDFRHPPRLPTIARPLPEEDLEVMHHAEGVDSDSDVDPAYISPSIRDKLGVPLEVKLPPALLQAAEDTGYTRGVRQIQRSVVKMQAAKRDEHLKPKPPPIGSAQLDEQMLRKVFQKMERALCKTSPWVPPHVAGKSETLCWQTSWSFIAKLGKVCSERAPGICKYTMAE